MAVLTTPVHGVWLPIAEAAVALGVSPDTIRRRIRRDSLTWKQEGARYLVHIDSDLAAHQLKRPIVEDVHPSIRALINLVKAREEQRETELFNLREELTRVRAELVLAQAALPAKKPWSPFEWVAQLWAAQS